MATGQRRSGLHEKTFANKGAVPKSEVDGIECAPSYPYNQEASSCNNVSLRLGHATESRRRSCRLKPAPSFGGRYVVVSSACFYRRNWSSPRPEREGFGGRREATNKGYGWAKRMQESLGKACAEEFGMSAAIARPYNAYGPGDNFDPARSHVIASLVKRFCDAKEGDIIDVWGDGTATRSFLYVDDFARGVLEVAEKYAVGDPVNIGADEEISIKDLAEMIAELTQSTNRFYFDPAKPSGQPRRRCDTNKAREEIGFEARVPLREGLTKTIEGYGQQRQS